MRGRPGKTALLGRGVGVGRVRDGVRGSSWAALGKFGLMGLGFGFGFLSHFYFLPSIFFLFQTKLTLFEFKPHSIK